MIYETWTDTDPTPRHEATEGTSSSPDLHRYRAVAFARSALARMEHREAVLHSIRRAFCRDYIEAGTILSAAERAEAACSRARMEMAASP